jgi:uncharacterized membrane protein
MFEMIMPLKLTPLHRLARRDLYAIIDDLLFAVKLLSALGCGLMAGLFFAFSVSVMRALAGLPSAAGVAAMLTIINPMFLAAFFGTAAACLLIMVVSLLRWHDPGATYLLVGSSLYLLSTFLVTLVFNVPNYRSRSGDFAEATDKLG